MLKVISEFVAPWALANEKMPIHMIWESDFPCDLIRIHLHQEFEVDEFFLLDKYWIHSAIKDMSILQRIWEELAIEKVNVDVRIGVERYFSASIPRKIGTILKTRRDLLTAIETKDRDREARLKYRYRILTKKTMITPGEIYELVRKLVSGEIFSGFLSVDDPYKIGSIEPVSPIFFIPEKVGVGVETDLNYQLPAAEGYLSFQKKDFSDRVSESFKKYI